MSRYATSPSSYLHACLASYMGVIYQPSKLTAMAYTALQIIARSRDKGIVIDDITKATEYLSGTVFYLVKSLVELGLMYVLV